jgi:hypothetical protein
MKNYYDILEEPMNRQAYDKKYRSESGHQPVKGGLHPIIEGDGEKGERIGEVPRQPVHSKYLTPVFPD